MNSRESRELVVRIMSVKVPTMPEEQTHYILGIVTGGIFNFNLSKIKTIAKNIFDDGSIIFRYSIPHRLYEVFRAEGLTRLMVRSQDIFKGGSVIVRNCVLKLVYDGHWYGLKI